MLATIQIVETVTNTFKENKNFNFVALGTYHSEVLIKDITKKLQGLGLPQVTLEIKGNPLDNIRLISCDTQKNRICIESIELSEYDKENGIFLNFGFEKPTKK
jgi:hypothetical protein